MTDPTQTEVAAAGGSVEGLVSVITPLFNGERYIEAAIRSVQAQTYPHWEMIVTDDGSTDGGFAKAQALASADPRVVVQKLARNGGTARARNAGLRRARGQYVAFLDADDYYRPDFLEKQIAFLRARGPFVFASYERLAPNSATPFIVRARIGYAELLRGCDISCLTALYDARVLGKRYFREDLAKREDYAYWLALLKDTPYAFGNPECLATYRVLEGSKSRNKLKVVKYIWTVFFNVEKLGACKSALCTVQWAWYGFKKYRDVR
jgi:glycosyltransferase involved in cell wall biosynthesis